MGTFVVFVIVFTTAGLAGWRLYQDKKSGKCCSGCSGCSGCSCQMQNSADHSARKEDGCGANRDQMMQTMRGRQAQDFSEGQG